MPNYRGNRATAFKALTRQHKRFVERREAEWVDEPFSVVWFEAGCPWNGRDCVWAVVGPEGRIWKQGGDNAWPPRSLSYYADALNRAYAVGQNSKIKGLANVED